MYGALQRLFSDGLVDAFSLLLLPSFPGYGNRFVRALDGTFPEAATRCGVNIVSGDYWQSDQMEFFVWSFARGVNISATGCVSTYSHGRWIIDVSRRLPWSGSWVSFQKHRQQSNPLMCFFFRSCHPPAELQEQPAHGVHGRR